MRKEVVFAIVAGILFGLVVALGVWRANSALDTSDKSASTENTDTPKEETPTPSALEFDIAVSEPENLDVTTQSPTTVKGIATQDTWVTLSTESDSQIIYNKDKNFETPIELSPGVNQLIVTLLNKSGDVLEKRLTLVYSTEFAKSIEDEIKTDDSDDEDATEESDEIREKVKNMIENAKTNPKAYLGTITDKTESTLQIKNGDGEIKQISFSDETTYVSIDDSTKTVAEEDVAIGDYVVAMGFVDESSVLDAKRMLITKELLKRETDAYIGTASVSEGAVELNVSDELSLEIEESRNTQTYIMSTDNQMEEVDFSDIEDGDTIIIVGEKEEGTITARKVQIVKKSEIKEVETDTDTLPPEEEFEEE